jgi:pimeloyl-ACP methyl ester carboxylesterase
VSQWLLRAIGVLLMLSALAVSMSRAPDWPVQALVARWAPAPSDFIEIKGQVLHLRDEGPRGDPLPLLLLHGAGASLHTWEGWARTLRTQHRVISIDLPGSGLTGPFGGEYAADDYGGDTLARFVLDLMDTLQLQRVVLVGNALGGEVAWHVASLAPQRVERLVLVAPTGLGTAPGALPMLFRVAGTPLLNRVGEYLMPRELVIDSLHTLYGEPARVTQALVERVYELTLREGNRRALGLQLRQTGQGGTAVEARLTALRQPTLLLWGERDRVLPPAAADRFVQLLPGSRLQRFPGLGHWPQEEDPAATVQAVQAFVAQAR